MTLPHTYRTFDNPDRTGSEVVVREATVSVGLLNHLGRTTQELSTPTPKGDDAVALAKAVLEAAGDTGHVVISTEELSRRDVAAAKTGADIGSVSAARSMRNRALELANDDALRDEDDLLAEAIRALPLLPDEEPTEVRHITDVVGRVIRTDRVPLTADTDA